MNKYVKIALLILAGILVIGFGMQIGEELRLLF